VQAAVPPPPQAPVQYQPAPVQYAPAPVQYESSAPPIPDAPAFAFSSSGAPAASAAASDLATFPRAAFRDRLAAFVLDVILVLIVYRVLDDFARLQGGAFFLFLLVYHIGFWTWKGTTVGGSSVSCGWSAPMAGR
jgi:hypothetical protein